MYLRERGLLNKHELKMAFERKSKILCTLLTQSIGFWSARAAYHLKGHEIRRNFIGNIWLRGICPRTRSFMFAIGSDCIYARVLLYKHELKMALERKSKILCILLTHQIWICSARAPYH